MRGTSGDNLEPHSAAPEGQPRNLPHPYPGSLAAATSWHAAVRRAAPPAGEAWMGPPHHPSPPRKPEGCGVVVPATKLPGEAGSSPRFGTTTRRAPPNPPQTNANRSTLNPSLPRAWHNLSRCLTSSSSSKVKQGGASTMRRGADNSPQSPTWPRAGAVPHLASAIRATDSRRAPNPWSAMRVRASMRVALAPNIAPTSRAQRCAINARCVCACVGTNARARGQHRLSAWRRAAHARVACACASPPPIAAGCVNNKQPLLTARPPPISYF